MVSSGCEVYESKEAEHREAQKVYGQAKVAGRTLKLVSPLFAM